jgi:molybdopterin molybdotransferase
MSSALPSYHEAADMVGSLAASLRAQSPATEPVALAKAAGRLLAQSLQADQDQPPFPRSTRDGFACRAAEASAHKLLRLAGSSRAGESPAGSLPPAAAWEIMTGAAVPAGADAVAMVEHVEQSEGKVRLLASRKLVAGENIVAQGAQARGGDTLLSPGVPITFAQIALAASCGYLALNVYARPRVAILTTGDELVDVDEVPGPAQIRNSNASMLAALVAAAGGKPRVLPRAADTAKALDRALAKVLDADLLLISGGVSAGKFDLVEPALARLGARFHFTGVRIQPGKPLVFGELPRPGAGSKQEKRDLPFFGLPGNPVSSAVTFLLFAAPVLAALAGSRAPTPCFALARLQADTDRRTKPGLTRFLPACCTFSIAAGQVPEVKLVPWQGSGDLAALARSNCFLVIPEETGSLEAGKKVRILVY